MIEKALIIGLINCQFPEVPPGEPDMVAPRCVRVAQLTSAQARDLFAYVLLHPCPEAWTSTSDRSPTCIHPAIQLSAERDEALVEIRASRMSAQQRCCRRHSWERVPRS